LIQTLTSPLQDYIKVFENVVPLDLCDALCDEFADSGEWVDTAITGGGVYGSVNKSVRSATTIVLSRQDVMDRNREVRARLDAALFKAAGFAVQQYADIYPLSGITKDTGYELLRYEPGQFFSQHTDSSEKYNRCISCSLILNDEYEGGEFAFFDRQMIAKTPKGSALLFPSNFMFPHEIMPVLSGTRYSVVTWFL
jgi:predicted 2-oxoglutarate/Fe(II)-dependent dioxygenase YbiX